MNVNTGEIMAEKTLKKLSLEEQKEFRKVREDLEETAQEVLEAQGALIGKESVIIDLKGNSPLAKWAKQERRNDKKQNKARNKRKQSKASKKRNRK